MAVQVVQLFPSIVLTGTAVPVYTAPAGPNTIAIARLRVRFANATVTATAVTAYAIPSGGSANLTTTCIPGESIAGNSHADFDIPVLAAGGILSASATTSAAITISQLDGIIFS